MSDLRTAAQQADHVETVPQTSDSPLEAALSRAYYYTDAGDWRGPEADEWERWHAVAKVALAQQAEPVAWRYWKDKWQCWEYSDTKLKFPAVPAGTKMEPLYAPPAAHQAEPWVKTYSGGKPNYTTQPNPVAWRFRTKGVDGQWRMAEDPHLIEQMREMGHWEIRALVEVKE